MRVRNKMRRTAFELWQAVDGPLGPRIIRFVSQEKGDALVEQRKAARVHSRDSGVCLGYRRTKVGRRTMIRESDLQAFLEASAAAADSTSTKAADLPAGIEGRVDV